MIINSSVCRQNLIFQSSSIHQFKLNTLHSQIFAAPYFNLKTTPLPGNTGLRHTSTYTAQHTLHHTSRHAHTTPTYHTTLHVTPTTVLCCPVLSYFFTLHPRTDKMPSRTQPARNMMKFVLAPPAQVYCNLITRPHSHSHIYLYMRSRTHTYTWHSRALLAYIYYTYVDWYR